VVALSDIGLPGANAIVLKVGEPVIGNIAVDPATVYVRLLYATPVPAAKVLAAVPTVEMTMLEVPAFNVTLVPAHDQQVLEPTVKLTMLEPRFSTLVIAPDVLNDEVVTV
jgi:hypothetical protein